VSETPSTARNIPWRTGNSTVRFRISRRGIGEESVGRREEASRA
jgi:hypothetical protein